MLRDEAASQGTRCGHGDGEEGLSSAIHRPSSNLTYCPAAMRVNLGKSFPLSEPRSVSLVPSMGTNTNTCLVGLFCQ